MSRRVSFVLDCSDAHRLEGFWSEALGYVNAGWPGDNYVVLVPRDGPGPVVILQTVPEPKEGKNRAHIDIHVPDIEGEAERLVSLGAKRLSEGPVSEHGASWIVLADPDGNEFCVCRAPG